MVKWLVAGSLIALVFFGWYFFGRSADLTGDSSIQDNEVLYRCDDDKSINAVFEDNQAAFLLSDGRSFNLLKVPVASGSKYTSRDGAIVLWVKDYSAFLEENDESTYAGCVVSLTSSSGGR